MNWENDILDLPRLSLPPEILPMTCRDKQFRFGVNRFDAALRCVAALLSICATTIHADDAIIPSTVDLNGLESSVQVIVETAVEDIGRFDVTRNTMLRVGDENIASVSPSGLVEPKAEGTTRLTATIDGREVHTEIVVRDFDTPAVASFRNDVNPILTKAGCNSGGCHGKAGGKNGFQLSLFGFDIEADYKALTMDALSRRVNPVRPEHSLLLLKGSATVPHGGGAVIPEGSVGYRRLHRWIAEGAPLEPASAADVERIEVYPRERALSLLDDHRHLHQQLRVIAVSEDGSQRDVTALAAYESSAPNIMDVSSSGLVEAAGVPGESALLVRYLGHIAVSRISVPRPASDFVRPPENNFVDTHVWNKLQTMGIRPSNRCDDATILRRASLDVIGTLPTAEEARAFLADADPKKREKLVDRLLNRSEYARYWSLLWADIMRVDANALGANRAIAVSRWLREQFQQNRPYNEMLSKTYFLYHCN